MLRQWFHLGRKKKKTRALKMVTLCNPRVLPLFVEHAFV